MHGAGAHAAVQSGTFASRGVTSRRPLGSPGEAVLTASGDQSLLGGFGLCYIFIDKFSSLLCYLLEIPMGRLYGSRQIHAAGDVPASSAAW
jgi:hypothetical protein